MGCFSTCFRSSKKHDKSKKTLILAASFQRQKLTETHEINEGLICGNRKAVQESKIADPIEDLVVAIKSENEKQGNTSFRRKVTSFDSLSRTSEEFQAQEGLIGNDEVKKEREESRDDDVEEKGGDNKKKEERKIEADSLSDSTISSLFTYPRNTRYQNCESSDDECVDMDLNKKKNPEDDEDDGKNNDMRGNYEEKNGSEDSIDIQEESSELFSISIESKKQTSAVESEEKEVSSPLKPAPPNRDKSQYYVHSVLNPIQNLGQWKVVSVNNTSPLENQEKENLIPVQGFNKNSKLMLENAVPISEEHNLNQPQQQHSKRFSNCLKNDEVTVDTSLSSWLMGSDKTTPPNENSPGSVGNSPSKKMESPGLESFEDRPILGVLTMEDLKQMSKSATPSPPGRSRCHSPDDMPIIGTVGSYWRHTGEANDYAADYTGSSGKGTSRRCRKGGNGMKGNFTPFQARLERAIDGATTAQV